MTHTPPPPAGTAPAPTGTQQPPQQATQPAAPAAAQGQETDAHEAEKQALYQAMGQPVVPFPDKLIISKFGLQLMDWYEICELVKPTALGLQNSNGNHNNPDMINKLGRQIILYLQACQSENIDWRAQPYYIVKTYTKDAGSFFTLWDGLALYRSRAVKRKELYTLKFHYSKDSFVDAALKSSGKTVRVYEWVQAIVIRHTKAGDIFCPGAPAGGVDVVKSKSEYSPWGSNPLQMQFNTAERSAMRLAYPFESITDFEEVARAGDSAMNAMQDMAMGDATTDTIIAPPADGGDATVQTVEIDDSDSPPPDSSARPAPAQGDAPPAGNTTHQPMGGAPVPQQSEQPPPPTDMPSDDTPPF